MKVMRYSPISKKLNTLEVPCTQDQYDAWENGHNGYIQDIMPDVSPELREFIMTGITPEEWDAKFKDG